MAASHPRETLNVTAEPTRKDSGMSTGTLAIAVLAVCLAIGGGIAALADTRPTKALETIELGEEIVRKEGAGDDIAGIDDDDEDRTKDGDATRGNDGTNGGNNTGDGDATDGNDGTGGGNNTADVTYDTQAGSATGGGTTE